jgi:broad specificity phosphatase PhoE
MRGVYVLRHAQKDRESGTLTEEGRRQASSLKGKLGPFAIVIAADRPRQTETALLITGVYPVIDERAGFVYESKEQHKRLEEQARVHPLSHAGVIFESPEFRTLAEIFAENLVSLIKETLEALRENEKALIISQDGVMAAAQRKLTHQPLLDRLERAHKPLEGYIVNENLELQELSP